VPRFNLLVLTNAVPGREEEFNAWYSDVHLADVLRVPGIVAAQRFRQAGHQRDPGPYPWQYLAIYECETEDVREVIAGLKARSGTAEMPLSDAMEAERYVCFFEPVTERRVAG